jgi:ABC transport system ATP-binding/permease protein
VGRNGCDKKSLLQILAGERKADAGDISVRRGLRIGYLPQEFEHDACWRKIVLHFGDK